MSRFAFHLFKHFPPRFVAMEQLFAHLPLVQRGHHGLKQPRDAAQPIRDGALGQGEPVIPQLLTEAVGRAAIEVFVQQDPRPDRHPQWTFRDETRRWRGRNDSCDLRALTRLVVALALDATHMGLDLDFDNARLFGAGKRQKCLTTGRAALRRLAQVVHFHHHGQGATITAAVPLTAGLLPPLASTGRF